MKFKNIFLLLSLILFFCTAFQLKAQNRFSTSINSNWNFSKVADTAELAANKALKWEKVNLPHTWNATDVMDDEPGYYRGIGWYKKTLFVPASWKNKKVYLHFEGAAQIAEVFINGKSVGKHTGSYTAFNFPISDLLKFSAAGNEFNEVVVKVDNSHHEDVAPLSGDFTFFGGLYRDVHLVVVDEIHFDMNNHATNGVFISTPLVTAAKANLLVKGAFINDAAVNKTVSISHSLVDAEGKTIQRLENTYQTLKGQKIDFSSTLKEIKHPRLWSVDDPYLYKLISVITDVATKAVLDEVINPVGFRWFKFDAAKGFFLNGKHLKLIGASRHQDFKNMGNALPDAMHVRDVELIKEMGGNFLRIAHYPQDPVVIEACDRLGILTSVETPIVNRITETALFAGNAKAMHLEMMRQNHNHPSLIIWAYMNEVLLKPRYEKGSAEQEVYFNKVTELAQALEDMTRKEDPSRYTMIPNHGNFDLYHKVKLTTIPQLVGWNLYHGWYSDGLEGFGRFLDKHHQALPGKPLLVTEYGADADNRLHSFNPERFDKTVEYTTLYHQVYLKEMMKRPFVAAAMIWNLAEFNSETRAETTPHVNSKGILTSDRKVKDAYRFYQANLLKKPYVNIGAGEWTLRSGFAASATELSCTQPIQVFSNHQSVTLKLNGLVIGSAPTQQGIALFKVPFVDGLNRLQAVIISNGREITDQSAIHFKLLSTDLNSKVLPFTTLNVSLGDKRYFNDELGHEIWLPEQPYTPGGWGYVGGTLFEMQKKGRHSYGSDKDILGTDLDPVYSTQRIGIKQFKLDVPDGEYEVTLHFAELLSEIKREELIYNLGNGKGTDEFEERIFNVKINGEAFLNDLSNREYLEPERAVAFKTKTLALSQQGISIDFTPIKGLAILNGVQVRRLK